MTLPRLPPLVRLVIGSLLAGGLPGVHALSLGPLQGAAVIGRALELTVQIQAEPGEDLAALCLEADVFHAETRQDPRSVRIQTDPSQPTLARISSTGRVDEPVVTLLLRAGCAQKITRRYVLLADPPLESLAPMPTASMTVPTPPVPAAAPSALAVPVSVPLATPGDRAAASAPGRPASAPAPARPGPAAVPANVASRPLASGSRLKLTAPRPPTSQPVLAPPATPPVLAASASEAAADAQAQVQEKIKQLERDMKAAQALVARQDAALVALQARLSKADTERFPVEVLYALVGLVLACLTAVGWLWSRLRRLQADSGEWWSNSVMTPSANFAETGQGAPVTAASLAQSLSGDSAHAGLSSRPMSQAAPSARPSTTEFAPTDLNNLIDFDLNQSKQPPDRAP